MSTETQKVDVLAVMQKLSNAAAMNASSFPESRVLRAHAEDALQARLAVAELIEALEESQRELQSCQAVIHLAGGFDRAYVDGAQKSLRRTDAALARVGGDA